MLFVFALAVFVNAACDSKVSKNDQAHKKEVQLEKPILATEKKYDFKTLLNLFPDKQLPVQSTDLEKLLDKNNPGWYLQMPDSFRVDKYLSLSKRAYPAAKFKINSNYGLLCYVIEPEDQPVSIYLFVFNPSGKLMDSVVLQRTMADDFSYVKKSKIDIKGHITTSEKGEYKDPESPQGNYRYNNEFRYQILLNGLIEKRDTVESPTLYDDNYLTGEFKPWINKKTDYNRDGIEDKILILEHRGGLTKSQMDAGTPLRPLLVLKGLPNKRYKLIIDNKNVIPTQSSGGPHDFPLANLKFNMDTLSFQYERITRDKEISIDYIFIFNKDINDWSLNAINYFSFFRDGEEVDVKGHYSSKHFGYIKLSAFNLQDFNIKLTPDKWK